MAKQGFIGAIHTEWLEDGREMRFDEPFGYVSKSGKVWWCYEDGVINGTSFPRLLFVWDTLGSPYVGKHRVAGALHDSAYHHHQGSRLECDRMLREVLIYCGVSKAKAYTMYAAVRAGGRGAYKKGPTQTPTPPKQPPMDSQRT